MTTAKIHISPEDKKRISLSIEKAESKTSGEILPMIVKMSDFYPAAHFRLGLLFSFGLGFCLHFLFPHWQDPLLYLYAQLPCLFLGYGLAYIPALKRLMITTEERKKEVHERAAAAFFLHQLSQTKKRTGVLIMVSLLERRVEILGDSAIASKVDQETWNQLVINLLEHIKKQDFVGGLCHTIEQCGLILSEFFPRDPHDVNELKDELIIE